MTGCSSYSPGSNDRNGDFFDAALRGRKVCTAYNGAANSGVYAYARCCSWPGMSCSYSYGNRSSSADDAGSMAFCPSQIDCLDAFVTGCSVKSLTAGLTGTKPFMPNYCQGYNEMVEKGLWVHAACCSAPNFNCKTKSILSGTGAGDKAIIGCDAGWILTGCSVRSPNHYSYGAYIDDNDNCVAVNGQDGRKIWALAVCCKDEY
ncbi:proprotein convertase subtilisin/kexin type 9-like [Saccoglossus kowalevskii]|uniref:Proprotein convertase subtilisin/kexin type 9-like n=1 Tax=Saccoglossus kowalevskii TaxID=10224 RepID=A0ABM0MTH6_SACKO|nr:PREDICTED: proprotein convertase subtilisin/kexin type 9-like [Saccoglossus kowalevskii]